MVHIYLLYGILVPASALAALITGRNGRRQDSTGLSSPTGSGIIESCYPATLITLSGNDSESEPETFPADPESRFASDEPVALLPAAHFYGPPPHKFIRGTLAPVEDGPFSVDKEQIVLDWVSQPHKPLVTSTSMISPSPPAPSPQAPPAPATAQVKKRKRYVPFYPRWQTDSERGGACYERLAKRQRRAWI